MNNINLNKAKIVMNDEHYTFLEDIEKELINYKKHFENKVIYCNCDDPRYSNFWKYFILNFDELKLKKLIATYYNSNEQVYKFEVFRTKTGTHTTVLPLQEDGSFSSKECIDLLKESDVLVTNPPFSKFKILINLLVKYDKKFVIIGSKNAISYKDFFPLIKSNKIWLGYNNVKHFKIPGGEIKEFGNIGWFTNLEISKQNDFIELKEKYDPDKYLKYDEYDAININKVKEIPYDYYGVMGVPISFLDKFNPKQFKIIGLDRYVSDNPHYGYRFKVNGKETYARILIKRKTIIEEPKQYKKKTTPIKFMVFDNSLNFDAYEAFLSDDEKNNVSFENGMIKVKTSWGATYEGKNGYILVKYAPGDYNLVEPAIFNNTYKIDYENKTAVKISTVKALEVKEHNLSAILAFAGTSFYIDDKNDYFLETLEGTTKINKGDFILQNQSGEFYPNKHNYFVENYTLVK